MDLDRLKTFLVLAEVQSFTEAAEQLYMSQPAVSKKIKSLEDELGVPLFSRVGKKNYLTIQGKSFIQYAQTILNTYTIGKEHILQIENLEEGNVFFGATNFIGVYLIPEILARFKQKYSKIDINFTINSSKNLLKEFDKATIEFGFLSGYVNVSHDIFEVKKIFNDELKLIVSSSNLLAQCDHISLEELAAETFVLKKKTSSLHKYLATKLGDSFFDDKDILTISNQEGIKEAIIQNLGVSFMSLRSIKYELELGLVKAIDVDGINLVREINLVYKKRHKLTPAAEKFIECLNEVSYY